MICLNCKKPRTNITRGQCNHCYNVTLERVRAGEVTWAELEAAGKSIPAQKRTLGRAKQHGRKKES